MWITSFDENSWRSIFKWGAPNVFKHPEKEMLSFIKKTFSLTDAELRTPHMPGLDVVKLDVPPGLPGETLTALENIVGADNLTVDDYERARHSCGKMYLDALLLRIGAPPPPPDAVVYPRDERAVVALVDFCVANGIVIIPVGGMSSVTRAIEFPNGGVCVDLTRHMDKIIEINELDSTCRVQPGIFGPAYEKQLNASRTKSAPTGYTGGHFPQSFEFSTVGGWIAAKGAGQQSTGYGKIEDIVISQRWITPAGVLETAEYPAAAIGPDIQQFMIGSEGVFGVMTEATLKIRKHAPDNRRYFSFMHRSWKDAVDTCREVMQGGFGFPSALRISDPEETMVGLKLHGIEGGPVDKIMTLLGYRAMKRCLMIGSTEGDPDAGELIKTKVKKIAASHGAFYMGEKPVKSWWKGRYADPYMREDLMDIQVITDTLETAVTWSNLINVWDGVRKVIKARPNTACMVHGSHFYENGANLYFIFLSRVKTGDEVDDYVRYQKSIIDAIRVNGGSLSHHHCVGRMLAPWLNDQIGETGMGLLRAVKGYFDPSGIMNPGGTLGLD